MEGSKIVVCGGCVCTFTEDVGCFSGFINWDGEHLCDLYLHCNPADLQGRLLIKLGFEAIFRERDYWTEEAKRAACDRFIPYFRHVTRAKGDLLEEVLPQYLVPCAIEFGIDGKLVIGFDSFYIGSRQSDLFVCGKVGAGFSSVKDGCYESPIV